MMPPANPTALLCALRRRVVAQALVRNVGAALLLAGAGLIGLAVWQRGGMGWLVGLPAGLAVFAGCLTLARVPGLAMVARAADRAGETRDRLASALAMTGEEPWQQAARAECAAWLRGRDLRGLFPWRLPREWRWLPVVVVAMGLLRWHGALERNAEKEARRAAQVKIAPTVAALQKLAQELPPRMKPLADEIARQAEALRRAPATPAEAEKAGLRELSALEQMVRELQQRPGMAELQNLAQELAKQELTRAAAEKMQAGDHAAAAAALEEAARKAAENPQASAELQAALDRLAEQKQLSEALREASRNGPAATLRKLAELLRQSTAKASGEQPAGQPASPQDLQRLLAALENLQAGEPSDHQEAPAGLAPGDPGPPMLQLPPAGVTLQGETPGQLPAAGRPGGEHDTGTTESPFGERQEAARKGADLALRGVSGAQGEVASQALPASADRARAKQQYKEMYEALAPAAEDAVLQEEIPLGSRLLIKRYFEAIRPRD